MYRPKLLIVALALLIAIAVFQLTTEPTLRPPAPNVTAMRAFLESQYVPEAGLLRASLSSYPDNETIWIANDNLLAVRALKLLGSPLWVNVSKSLARYNVSSNGRVDPLLGRLLDGFFCPEVRTLGSVHSEKFNVTFTLKIEVANRSCILSDWSSYADLVVYGALSDLLLGKKSEAFRLYSHLLSMWDGNGFRDKAFAGTYQSYKCALFVYLHRALGEPGGGHDVYFRCLEILSALQSENGGIITGYKVEKERIIPIGDPNTETTAMVVIGLYGDPPQAFQT
ncbi:hypothetical protein X802_00855 [Thermococcus guaymasensis DSM 11113]|uniref:Uncharacterized protein n=1 Tax=Thermococcus guaymasensis DSM 11113 TaxID=1432656 RepID=A0A0X1KI06_9EURY|nr:hypothetical protein [Thermococcus guaymasensis]AJC70901.1 hypothetical protein X802_00855 [Thermococcus guaymasensis DSM 11113]